MPGEALAATAARVWPTLRLAVLTTVFGSLAMLFSGFVGLAQLGLLTFAGALAAGLATRYVLPGLVPERWTGAAGRAAPAGIDALARQARRLAWSVPAALALAVAVLALRAGDLWERDLENLNPIAEAAKQRDQALRDALGAPDVRYLVVVAGATREAVLERLESLAPRLHELAERGLIRSFDTPARYLPSEATQRARQAAIPGPDELERRIAAAAKGLPFRDGLFAPFLADAERARTAAPITEADLDGTVWGLAARSLLAQIDARPVGLVPLTGVADGSALAAAIVGLRDPAVSAFDLKAESDALLGAYRNESLGLWALGLAAIVFVLALGLRDARAVARVVVPVLTAIAATAALLALGGVRLSLLHLVALLLVLGIGTNYSLFFGQFVPGDAARRRNAYAVLVAAATTLVAFGALATSATPILRAIGLTVALGTALSLAFAAAWAQPGPE
jgi:predicted exporter